MMASLSLMVVGLLTFTHLPSTLSRSPVMVVNSWGERFCRPSFCALIGARQWSSCCKDHGQCCAYVDLVNPKGPYSFEESGEVDSLEAERHNPVATPDEPKASSDQLPRFERLHATPIPQAQPQPQPQPELQPRTQQPPSYSLVRLPKPNSPPPRSFNEVLQAKNREMCRPRYCSLLTSNKQKQCCRVYRQCCAYVNYTRDSDPFYMEKDPVWL